MPSARLRLPLLTALAWLAAAGALAQVLVSLFWHDCLAEVGRGMLAAHYAAFMAQTFAFHAGIAMVPVLLFAAVLRRRATVSW